jgi:hypothetical protein
VCFREDNQVRSIRGRFTDETDGFGDGRFGVEKYWGDVASCMSINTDISRMHLMSDRKTHLLPSPWGAMTLP